MNFMASPSSGSAIRVILYPICADLAFADNTWAERLQEFLSLNAEDIGSVGAGKRKPTGRIDVAVIQRA